MATRKEIRAAADAIAATLTDRGQLIEAGWVLFRGMTVPVDASEVQIREMRFAFMAGAQHLFGSIMGIMDGGEEPTERDLSRMALIDEELKKFEADMRLRYNQAEGSA